jgi:hypothetical protein
MHPSHAALSLLPATATRLLPGEVLLNPPEPPLGPPGELRGPDALAIGEDEQVLQTEVYPDWVDRSRGFYVRNLKLGTQGNVPVSASVSLEGRALGRSFDSSGETDTNPTYLRDVYPAVLDSDALGDTESEVSSFLGAQPGEAATPLEERIVCPIHVCESLLEHLRVGLFKPERIRLTLDGRQLGGKLSGGDALAVFGIVAFTSVQSPIVDEPTGSGHPVQSGLLSLRRAHPEPVDLSQQHELEEVS